MINFIVITENDESEWDDRTGVRYHYPRKYKNTLQPGSYFVYYKGKQRKKQYADSRMSADPHYFGVGIIGNSFEDENSEKKDLFCEIIDFEPFEKAVLAKTSKGFLEIIPERKKKNFWRDAVRVVSQSTYEKIVELAGEVNLNLSTSDIDKTKTKLKFKAVTILPENTEGSKKRLRSTSVIDKDIDFIDLHKQRQIKGRKAEELVFQYEQERLTEEGRPDLADQIQDYSKKYSCGFDIRSYNADGSIRDIEVKASKSNGFIISRNELKKSISNLNYWIYVVSDRGKEVVIKRIASPDLLNAKEFSLEPKDYYVSFTIRK